MKQQTGSYDLSGIELGIPVGQTPDSVNGDTLGIKIDLYRVPKRRLYDLKQSNSEYSGLFRLDVKRNPDTTTT
eukprot:8671305-Pyramimonas_sp.AAC.1